jgi:lambda family phage portal protein
MAQTRSWFDRMATSMAPRWKLKRLRARMAVDVIQRHYEGGGTGRRTQGWRRSGTDANQALAPFLSNLRNTARELVRNNPYAESALTTIVDHAVGWGIVAKALPANKRLQQLWDEWANSTACDADNRHNLAGLQKLVLRAVARDGEVLVRRRLRRPEDGFKIPLQLQVLEADFLDSSRDTAQIGNSLNTIIQGVEFDAIGRITAYWLFPEHPGSALGAVSSVRVPAENVLHIFETDRPGQVRGVSWFSPVLLRFKDFDDLEDATLMKQKIAACLAVITSDVNGDSAPLGVVTGTTDDTASAPEIDMLEPGGILNVAPGRTVDVVQPPSVREYADYSKTILRAIATGLGVPYEDLTGDYTEMPFSAARMSRLRHWSHVEDWRWRLVVPQFCDPVFAWFAQVVTVTQNPPIDATASKAEWTAPPAPMIDPVNEGLAYMRNRRAGLTTLSESLRERGYDPKQVLNEYAAENKELDRLGIILDSDPRQMTQAGQLQGEAAAGTSGQAGAAADDEMAAAARKLRLASGDRR